MAVSVIFPVKNREEYVKRAVKTAFKAKHVMEVIVVDGGSSDRTVEVSRKEGAKVIVQSNLVYPGKGIAMRDGAYLAEGDILVFLDIDIKNLTPDFIESLAEPLINGWAEFVKGCFDRAAGRVTELVAKPLLRMFYPELAKFKQPLSGEIAGLRKLFYKVEFERGWGVDVGLLIDFYKLGAKIVEKDLGYKDHEMKPLHALTDMAYEVAEAILKRAIRDRKIDVYWAEKYLKSVKSLDLKPEVDGEFI
ncbi:MAG: glycosyltransferase [Candidatus Nezhaarchaeota archaeon]|nr:glycosyltransferase [Candidatus Nezhaarchaeota archaeon]